MNKKITLAKAMNLIQNTKGHVFRATFIKRTTGEVRNMVCRLGVAKNITGAGLRFDPADKQLLVVFDFQKKNYRMISLDSLTEIKTAGKVYRIK